MQNDDHMYELLEQVKTIIKIDKAERLQHGQEFNIFSVQGVFDDEVKICRLLRELLDPLGSHGQGDIFLRLFLHKVLKTETDNFRDIDYDRASVTREELIDNGKRIDLVVRVGSRIIPIEVKIYATDQYRQCYDYYKYVSKRDSNAIIYYLTLDGSKPSEDSRGSLSENQYKCISFGIEILEWLNDCIKADEIEQIYSIREVLIQFRESIKMLIGIEQGKDSMEIKNTIISSMDNFTAALHIANILPKVKAEKMKEVFKSIQLHLYDIGYKECIPHFEDEADKYYAGKNVWPNIT